MSGTACHDDFIFVSYPDNIQKVILKGATPKPGVQQLQGGNGG